MPHDPVGAALRLATDPSAWHPAPGPDGVVPGGARTPVSHHDWAEQLAARVWESAGVVPETSDLMRLVGLLEVVGDPQFPDDDRLPDEDAGWSRKWVHLPYPGELPLPLLLAYGPAHGDRAATLRRLVCADDPQAVEPPVVEEVATPAGPAVRGMAYLSEAGRGRRGDLLAALSYAWRLRVREQDVDVRLWTAFDTGRVESAARDIDAAAQALRVVR
jgi:hypothetical protein